VGNRDGVIRVVVASDGAAAGIVFKVKTATAAAALIR